MPDPRVVLYHLACAVGSERRHLIDVFPKDYLRAIITTHEVSIYLRKRGDYYVAREVVVGGDEAKKINENVGGQGGGIIIQ